MMKKRIYIFLLIAICTVHVSCSPAKENFTSLGDGTLQMINHSSRAESIQEKDESFASKVKETALELPEIYDVHVIKGKKESLVTYKVRHMQRFRMKRIEKELIEKLQEKFPDERFTVSSDFKIFLESTRLQKKIHNNEISEEEMEEKLQWIIQLSKEKT